MTRIPLISKARTQSGLSSIGKRLVLTLDWRTVLAFGLPFLLYLNTLAPTIYNLDSAEFTTAVNTGGIVRATGYPLYLILGWLWSWFWSWLPLDNIGDRGYWLNLFSAFNGALTIALAERILRRWQISPWASFGALGLLTCATYFWAMSLIAEVYTLHTALMAGLILLLLKWVDQPTSPRLAWLSLLLGLSFGNHLATVLLLPGIVFLVITTRPEICLKPAYLIRPILAFILGLSVYLYLPLRYQFDPPFNYAGMYNVAGNFTPVNLQTPAGLWWLVSGRVFAGQMLAYTGPEWWNEIKNFGVQLWRAFFAIGLGPGLLGIFVMLKKNWRIGFALVLFFSVNAFFYIGYRVVDKNTMFLPAYLIWAFWLAQGYQTLLTWIRHQVEPYQKTWETWVLQGLIIGSVGLALIWQWPLVNLADDWSARERGETILQKVEPNALIFGWWETVPLIEYLQLVEDQRPDVQAINRFLISSEDMRTLIRNEVSHRPIYIDSIPSDLLDIVTVREVSPLYRITPRTP